MHKIPELQYISLRQMDNFFSRINQSTFTEFPQQFFITIPRKNVLPFGYQQGQKILKLYSDFCLLLLMEKYSIKCVRAIPFKRVRGRVTGKENI